MSKPLDQKPMKTERKLIASWARCHDVFIMVEDARPDIRIEAYAYAYIHLHHKGYIIIIHCVLDRM